MINWGKETLGTADKPVLLVMIGGAVLVALRGGRPTRAATSVDRRCSCSVPSPWSGMAAVISRLPGQWQALLPTLIGLAVGYLVTASADRATGRSGRGRPLTWTGPSPASPGSSVGPELVAGRPDLSGPVVVQRRSFLRATVLIGAGGRGRRRSSAGSWSTAPAKIAEARSRIRLPAPATRRRKPVPAGADLAVPGLSPYVTPNDDFYRIDTALQVPVIDPDDVDAEGHRAWSSARSRSPSPSCWPDR